MVKRTNLASTAINASSLRRAFTAGSSAGSPGRLCLRGSLRQQPFAAGLHDLVLLLFLGVNWSLEFAD